MKQLLAGLLVGLVVSAAGAAHLELSLGALLGQRAELAALASVALLALFWRPDSRHGPWWAAALVGFGLGISGLIPASAAVALGEGHLVGGVVLVGIFGGAWLHDRLRGPPHDSDYSRPECNQG